MRVLLITPANIQEAIALWLAFKIFTLPVCHMLWRLHRPELLRTMAPKAAPHSLNNSSSPAARIMSCPSIAGFLLPETGACSITHMQQYTHQKGTNQASHRTCCAGCVRLGCSRC